MKFELSDARPRSREVTQGLEKTAARGMLRATGMDDADLCKPQVGVASSWNEITPCNMNLDRLAQAAKEGVYQAGGHLCGMLVVGGAAGWADGCAAKVALHAAGRVGTAAARRSRARSPRGDPHPPQFGPGPHRGVLPGVWFHRDRAVRGVLTAAQRPGGAALLAGGQRGPGSCFIHVGDALELWKQLRQDDAPGVGQIAERDYGLREFVMTDPDSNRIRFGSPNK